MTTTSFDGGAFVQDFVQAMNKRDAEPLMRYYSDHVILTDPTTTTPLRGKEGVRKNVHQWGSSMSDLKVDIKDVVVSGDKAAVRFEASGRHTGELEIAPGETIPATNKNIRLEIANFLTLDGSGKITEDRTIFDVASMMMQLGLLPAPHSGGASKSASANPSRSR